MRPARPWYDIRLMGMLLRLYLGRHGQTDWNADLRLQGWTDIPLNETGRLQAREIAEVLKSVPLDCIYSSALQRSRETAETIAAGRPVVSLPELNEQSLGRFEGKILDGELLEEFRRRRQDPDDSLDGGESRNQHLSRVRKALDLIRSRHLNGGNVLLIGHGGTNNLILQTLLRLTADLTFRISNSELYLIELPAGAPPLLWKRVPAGMLNHS